MNVKGTVRFGVGLLSLALLAGCQTTQVRSTEPALQASARIDDPAPLRELAEAADRTSRSLRLLASAQSAEARKHLTPETAARITQAETTTPPGWGKPNWIEFTGAADLLVKRLAETAGYRFFEVGKRPPVMPLVEVYARGNTLIETLRDAMAQMPSTLRVNVYPHTRTVVMSYGGSGA